MYTREWYENYSETVPFYTSVPSLAVLGIVYDRIKWHLSEAMKLSRYQQLLVWRVKLKMNYLFRDIAYQLNVSVSRVQRVFHYTLNALYVELHFLIQWHSSSGENLRKSMPMRFRQEFGNKVVVIIDCFELFTEKPSGAVNTVLAYSNCKHLHTVKNLIGIDPQGPSSSSCCHKSRLEMKKTSTMYSALHTVNDVNDTTSIIMRIALLIN